MVVVVVEVVVVVRWMVILQPLVNLNLGCRSSSLICLVSMTKAMKAMAMKKAMKMAKTMKKAAKKTESEVVTSLKDAASDWVKITGYVRIAGPWGKTQIMMWPSDEAMKKADNAAMEPMTKAMKAAKPLAMKTASKKKPAMKAAMKATKKK